MSKFDPAKSPAWYRSYVVFALAAVYAVNVMDRSLLTILQQPIKVELHLSDTQLGALTGLAFAVFYATLAVPIARFADRSNRALVLCASLALWSAMTAGCGTAMGFVTLLLFRMGVGVGEAGGYPPSASLLSDYFGKSKRATALALFGLGAPIGQTLGLFTGGWLHGLVGWRGAFFIVGSIGVLLAPVILFTVREPQRGVADQGHEALPDAASASLWQCAKVLWRLKTIRYLYIAHTLHGFVQYAHASWTPPFYARTFAMTTGHVAYWLGWLSICGALGTFAGGVLADRLGAKDPRWRIWIMAVSSAILVPSAVAQFLVPDRNLSLALAAAPYFLLSVYVAPTIAAGQTLVLPHMRATTAAIMLLVFNIFGLGLGPLAVGVLSDLLNTRLGLGAQSLRYALVAAVLVEAVAVVFYLLSGRALPVDMNRDRSLDFSPEQAGERGVGAPAMRT